MNNHWHTNYRADQEGQVRFHFALRPHQRYDPAQAMRFGVESTEPLLATPAAGEAPKAPRLHIEPASVMATAFKPGDDGKAIIVRLFGASGKMEKARLTWDPAPKSVFLSDSSEQPLQPVKNPIKVPGWGLVTLRAETTSNPAQ
jgi:alpha-mannosidase